MGTGLAQLLERAWDRNSRFAAMLTRVRFLGATRDFFLSFFSLFFFFFFFFSLSLSQSRLSAQTRLRVFCAASISACRLKIPIHWQPQHVWTHGKYCAPTVGMGSAALVVGSALIKPVLNWANVCSPAILRTVRRTTIRFLIELLLRRTLVRTVRRTMLRS